MSRKGNYFSLNAQELGKAFEAAQQQDADYLVVIAYDPSRAQYRGLGDANYVDTYERSYPVTRDNAASQLAAIFKQHSTSNIRRVYDAKTRVQGDVTMLPAGAYESAKATATVQQKTRPVWKRVFCIK